MAQFKDSEYGSMSRSNECNNFYLQMNCLHFDHFALKVQPNGRSPFRTHCTRSKWFEVQNLLFYPRHHCPLSFYPITNRQTPIKHVYIPNSHLESPWNTSPYLDDLCNHGSSRRMAVFSLRTHFFESTGECHSFFLHESQGKKVL